MEVEILDFDWPNLVKHTEPISCSQTPHVVQQSIKILKAHLK